MLLARSVKAFVIDKTENPSLNFLLGTVEGIENLSIYEENAQDKFIHIVHLPREIVQNKI